VTRVSVSRVLKHRALHLMLLAPVLYLVINNYLPMVGVIIAFKNVNYARGIFRSDWVGFYNLKFLFATQDAYIITRNTLLYNVLFIVLNCYWSCMKISYQFAMPLAAGPVCLTKLAPPSVEI
jgi:putative aldouronate transport system permease protein